MGVCSVKLFQKRSSSLKAALCTLGVWGKSDTISFQSVGIEMRPSA